MCAFCNGLGVGKDRQMMQFAVSSIGLARQEQFWLQKMTTVPQRSSQMKIHDPSHPMREATTIAAPGPWNARFRAVASVDWHSVMMVVSCCVSSWG